MTIRYRSNLAGGILAILLGAVLLLVIPQAIGADSKWSITYGVTSRTIPYTTAWVMIACGAALIVKSLVFKKDETREIHLKEESRGLLYMAALGVFAVIFRFSYILAALFLGEATLGLMKCRKPLYYVIVAVLVGVLYFVFSGVLKVRLPKLFL